MASLTIRNLDDELKERLRVRAAGKKRSMEEEARQILKSAVSGTSGPDLWHLSRQLFDGPLGADLEVPSRADDRPALDLGQRPNLRQKKA